MALEFPEGFPFTPRRNAASTATATEAMPDDGVWRAMPMRAAAPIEAPAASPIEAPAASPIEAPAASPIEAPAPTPIEAPVAALQPSRAIAIETMPTEAASVAAAERMAHAKLAATAPDSRPAMERRRAARQTLVARATFRADNPMYAAGPPTVGYVSNISLIGVGFHTRKPLELGECYSIKLEVGPMKWTSRLRIVSCNQFDPGTWDIGAQFVGNELATRGSRLAA